MGKGLAQAEDWDGAAVGAAWPETDREPVQGVIASALLAELLCRIKREPHVTISRVQSVEQLRSGNKHLAELISQKSVLHSLSVRAFFIGARTVDKGEEAFHGGVAMPTYEYECPDCGYRFEEFQKMSDEPVKRCPKCNGKVKRLISAGSGIIFKGSGFYATDYARKKDDASGCCGMTNPCDNPKRCCGK
jgi:putative FmdB family regulatory protein